MAAPNLRLEVKKKKEKRASPLPRGEEKGALHFTNTYGYGTREAPLNIARGNSRARENDCHENYKGAKRKKKAKGKECVGRLLVKSMPQFS